MSQDSGKGLRPRQYGGTNQLNEDKVGEEGVEKIGEESTYVKRAAPGRQADNIS